MAKSKLSFVDVNNFKLNFVLSPQQTSNAFTFVEVKQLAEKKSNNLDLIKHLDQYMTLIGNQIK